MKNLPAELSSNLETTGALELYLAELRKTPLLSKQEELELFNKLNNSDDIDADEDEIRDALDAMDDVGEHEFGDYILQDDETSETEDKIIIKIIQEEIKFVLEKRKKRKKKKKKKKKSSGKKDACYHKVRSRYKVWPSAYASGALVRCRKVGAKNWGNKSKKKK